MTANLSASGNARTFKKSYVKQYGILFVVVPLAFLFIWMAVASPQARTASLICVVVCILFSIIPFVQVSSITVESNKLKIETFLEEKIVSAHEVQEIKMKAVRGRYGRVTNFVNIVLAGGKNYPLNGFVDGDEFIYGFLTNWWEANRG